MSTETIKEFLVGLGFQVDEKSLNNFNQGVFKAGVGITTLGNLASEAIQKVITGVSEALSVKRYAEELDKIDELSNRTKVAADDILRMGYQAQISGSSIGALQSSLDGLTKTAGLAAIGMGRGKKVFEEIGVEVLDANGKLKDTAVIIGEVGGKIKDMERGKQLAIIGRLGLDPTLIRMMTEDMSELNAEYNELVKVSGFAAGKASQDAGEYMDQLDKLHFTIGFIGKAAAARLFGRLSDGMERLRKLLVANMAKILNLIDSIARFVLYLSNVFTTTAARIFNVLAGIVGWLSRVNEATNGWLFTIGALIVAWRLFNLSVLATPIGAILALAAGLAALVEDFYVFTQGGESLIDWQRWVAGFDSVMDVIHETKDLLTALFTFLFASIDFVISLLTGNFSGAWNAIKEQVLAVIEAISRAFGLVDAIGSAIGNIAGAFSIGGSMLTPSPVAAAGLSGSTQTVTQKTDIVVQGGADPLATGRAVADQQGRVNADMTRNLGTRAR